ncbi:MAG: FkbM family methyltransferase [Candidatus Udaeobacter sp.]
MNLFTDANAEFTNWVVKAGILLEPFVLVDIGVQGGENPSWHRLGDYLIVHGFDALEEAIDQLRKQTERAPNRHYHRIAAGNADEERVFYFNPANPTASSMYSQGSSRFEASADEQARSVTVRRLDTLFAEGLIPKVDFLKVDVEGFEKDVLLGANNLLANVLGVETETNFGVSAAYPKSHFGTLAEILLEHHLLVFDLAFNRIPRASFRRALERKGIKTGSQHDGFGKPAMVNVLFCRDLIDETDAPSKFHTQCNPFSLDQLIKLMIIYELHGLNDIALDTAERFAELLGSRFDVDRAIRLLANPDCRPGGAGHEELRKHIYDIEHSTSWRVTAPLRAAKGLLASWRLR